MATFTKWFINSSILLAIVYIFGIYLDITKEIFVSNFFYSPFLQFLIIAGLLISLVLIESRNKANTKNSKRKRNEGLLYIHHQNFSVDVNLLRDELDEILDVERSISASTIDIYKEEGIYFFNFLVFLRKNAVVALEPLSAKLNAQIRFLLQEKFGESFPCQIHIRYANERDPFPTLDEDDARTENTEPIEIPTEIGRDLSFSPPIAQPMNYTMDQDEPASATNEEVQVEVEEQPNEEDPNKENK